MSAAQGPDAGDLQISPLQPGPPAVLEVAGEVDAHTCGRLKSALDEALGGEGAPDVVVDMAGVSFLDSSGLRVLIGAYKAAEEQGGRFRLRSPADGVTRLLEITGLAERFLEG